MNAEVNKDQTPKAPDSLGKFPDDQQEDEDDLGKVSYKDAVVTNTDWTIESITLQMEKGRIDLQPSFQRRAAWDDTRKSRLIESIIVGMPVPNIVLAEVLGNRGRFIVIDGKQRLLAIRDFIAGEYTLRGLDLRPDLKGLAFADFKSADREAFENSTLRATLIKNWNDEKFLWAAFYRLNSGSLPLSPQELRKALIGGHLIDAIEEYVINSSSFHAVFGDRLDKRMRDSELVLRFISFDRDIKSYRGDFKEFLDNTTRYFEEGWKAKAAEARTEFDRLDVAISTAHKIFERDVFRKWLGNSPERVINRAIFDCIARFFADEEIAELALAKSTDVKQGFISLCREARFLISVESSTKTQAATTSRISMWGSRLGSVIGKKLNPETLRLA